MSALERLAAQPSVYDWIQRMLGVEAVSRRLRPFLLEMEGSTVLDAGGGTGRVAGELPEGTRYYLLDVDQKKLAYFQRQASGRDALAASVTHIPLPDQSVDFVVCVAVTHHLNDAELASGLHEMARVARSQLLLLDAVARPKSTMSRLLWKWDRGAHARSEKQLRRSLATSFQEDTMQTFQVYHQYLLFYGHPRR